MNRMTVNRQSHSFSSSIELKDLHETCKRGCDAGVNLRMTLARYTYFLERTWAPACVRGSCIED